ncbi:MAG: methyltransferase [Caldimicrobium sp.]
MKEELNMELEEEAITLRGKTLKILRPKRLEDIFQGDPFLETEKFPFWFKIWEGSLILADYLATLSEKKKILELGCGLGVVSLFASAFGHEVLATDIEELPLKILQKSAELNNLSFKIQKLDILNPELKETFDIIAASEILYKKSFYDPLLKFFKDYLKPTSEVLLAHSEERKRTLISFLVKAQNFFEIQTSVRRLKSPDETATIILNRLIPKAS